MERLTTRLSDGQAVMCCKDCKTSWIEKHGKEMEGCTAMYCRNRCKDRLGAYEDTGLTPEEIMAIRNTLDEYHKKADPLLMAQAECRVVVLPCKVGDTVYWVHNKTITRCRVYRVQKNRKGIFICLRGDGKSYGAFLTDLTIGKTIFLTREEAEEALRRFEDEYTK